MILFVAHDFGTGNGPERLELGTEFFVINIVVDILDVEVDALILAKLLHLSMLVRLLQLFLTFGLLLCSSDVKLLAIVVAVVKGIDSFRSVEVVLKVDETKALALSLRIDLEDSGGDWSEIGEHLPESFLRDLSIQVLDVDVGELFLLLVDFCHTFLIGKRVSNWETAEARRCTDLLGHVVSNEDLLIIEQHTIDGLDGRLGRLGAVIVNEAVTLRASSLICCDLARKNVTEGSEGIMKSLRHERVRRTGHRRDEFADSLPCCRSARRGS